MNMSLATRAIVATMFACAANAQLHSLSAQSCTGKGARTDWFARGVVKGPDPVSAADRAVIEPRLSSPWSRNRILRKRRLVLVRLPHNYDVLNDLNRQMYRELDWAALKALVNSPKR